MRFGLNRDRGYHIGAWVVPDNPLAISRVRVSVNGHQIAEVSATQFADNMLKAGWHKTGQCVLAITQDQIPDLGKIERLELYDADTNVLVYRRAPPENLLTEKVMLVNTSIYPETAIQTTLFPYFRQCYFNIGQFAEETLTSMFNASALNSGLFSGRIIIPRYENSFSNTNTIVMLLIHDPFVEMANRLIWLRERAEFLDDTNQKWRLGDQAEAALFIREYDLSDPKSLKRLFRAQPESVYRLLSNPLTHQLSARTPDERVRPRNSITAVETLARIAIVGHDDYFDAFVMTIYDRFGIELPVPKKRAVSEEVLALAAQLRALKIAQDMVNYDSVISDAVRKSVAKIWDA